MEKEYVSLKGIDNKELSNVFALTEDYYFSEKQKQAVNTCLNSFEGMNYKECEEVLYSLLSKIKTTSLVQL